MPAAFDDIESVRWEQWQEKARLDLKGRPLESLQKQTEEALPLSVLYRAPEGPASLYSVEGERGWSCRPELALGDVAAAEAAGRKERERGADALALCLDRGTQRGGTTHGAGLHLGGPQELKALWEALGKGETPLCFTVGAAAGRLWQWCKDAGIEATLGEGAGILGDPYSALLREGSLAVSHEEAFASLASVSAEAPASMRTIGISTATYHEAGAGEVEELALGLATFVAYLRELEFRGLDPASLESRFELQLVLDRDLFLNVAKLRAARKLWERVGLACGMKEGQVWIHGRNAWRSWTRYGAWENLLRATVGSFAGAVGGVDSLSTLPFDARRGGDTELARRMAINTQVILKEEAHLEWVKDPARGSWYVESLTGELIEAAWQRFRTIEAEGGLRAGIESGRIQAKLAEQRCARESSVSRGRTMITGISEYPQLEEKEIPGETTGTTIPGVDPWMETLHFEDAQYKALAVERRPLADGFESLRDAVGAFVASGRERPRVFVARMGTIARNQARADFARNFFTRAGFEVEGEESFSDSEAAAKAFEKSVAKVVVVASDDTYYAEEGDGLVAALQGAGASLLFQAGPPPPEAREGDPRVYIHRKCESRETLLACLRHCGVGEVR